MIGITINNPFLPRIEALENDLRGWEKVKKSKTGIDLIKCQHKIEIIEKQIADLKEKQSNFIKNGRK